MNMNRTLLILVSLLSGSQLSAAGADEQLFASLHGHASFNVVFAVLGIILTGILVYLWRLDRKANKLIDSLKK